MRNDESKAFNIYQFFYQYLVFQTFEIMTFLYLYIYKQPTKYYKSDKNLFLIKETCYKKDKVTKNIRLPYQISYF